MFTVILPHYKKYAQAMAKIAEPSAVGLSGYFQWLWDCGPLVKTRYAVGQCHEALFGYEPEGRGLQYKAARWLRLSGY
jgi:hypothetical protein